MHIFCVECAKCKNNYVHVRCNIIIFPKKFSMFPRPMQQNSVPQTGCRQPIILTKFVAVFNANSVP